MKLLNFRELSKLLFEFIFLHFKFIEPSTDFLHFLFHVCILHFTLHWLVLTPIRLLLFPHILILVFYLYHLIFYFILHSLCLQASSSFLIVKSDLISLLH